MPLYLVTGTEEARPEPERLVQALAGSHSGCLGACSLTTQSLPARVAMTTCNYPTRMHACITGLRWARLQDSQLLRPPPQALPDPTGSSCQTLEAPEPCNCPAGGCCRKMSNQHCILEMFRSQKPARPPL